MGQVRPPTALGYFGTNSVVEIFDAEMAKQ